MREVNLLLAGFSLVTQGVFASQTLLPKSSFTDTGRIVGGTPAIVGEFPFIVSLQRAGRHFCGGSLIEKNWVLTAAHCVRSVPSDLKIRIGLLNQGDVTDVETFSAAKVVIHPENSSTTNDYDFALIRLEGESRFTPITLNNSSIVIPDEETEAPLATTAGWGTTSQGGKVSSKLLKVDVPLVSQSNCEAAYKNSVTKSMICAGYVLGGKDSCQGDSGGPLIVSDPSGEKRLVGVVSWGEGCARPKKYGVYADIFAAGRWIENQLGEAE